MEAVDPASNAVPWGCGMAITALAPDTGSAAEDFRQPLRGLMRFYAGTRRCTASWHATPRSPDEAADAIVDAAMRGISVDRPSVAKKKQEQTG